MTVEAQAELVEQVRADRTNPGPMMELARLLGEQGDPRAGEFWRRAGEAWLKDESVRCELRPILVGLAEALQQEMAGGDEKAQKAWAETLAHLAAHIPVEEPGGQGVTTALSAPQVWDATGEITRWLRLLWAALLVLAATTIWWGDLGGLMVVGLVGLGLFVVRRSGWMRRGRVGQEIAPSKPAGDSPV